MLTDKEIHDIVVQYENKIRRYHSSKVSNNDDIDDLVQETLYSIIKSLPNFSQKSKLSTWIYSICRNTLYNYYYQKKKYKTIIHKLTDHFMNEAIMNQDFEKVDIKLFIEKLEKPLYTVYDLFYKKNYKIKEIAKLMDKPEGTIKYLLYTLRMKVKSYYSNPDSDSISR